MKITIEDRFLDFSLKQLFGLRKSIKLTIISMLVNSIEEDARYESKVHYEDLIEQEYVKKKTTITNEKISYEVNIKCKKYIGGKYGGIVWANSEYDFKLYFYTELDALNFIENENVHYDEKGDYYKIISKSEIKKVEE